MDSIIVALPMRPDMSARGRQFLRELTQEKATTHQERHASHGWERLEIWRQTQPVDCVIIRIEADDIVRAHRSRADADHEFERWFDDVVKEVTGVDWMEFTTEKLLDWHQQHGHRQTPAQTAQPKRYGRRTAPAV